ncbi:UDP-N-acetylglucosamine:LPS N-acetylglucosamine transferase [Paraburkholderia sp. GAS199]|uniref:hypothetical protein n=1 Tax=Paraburkholderia sp. GAS199 TaxID=3035126 RepID=UPI003D1A0766
MHKLSVGYYVHHHGRGHERRAFAVAAELPVTVTLFGSNLPVGNSPEGVRNCNLPADHEEGVVADSFAHLHYAPLGVKGIRERSRILVDWFEANWPCVLVVDVSVEVAALARLCSIPVIYVRQRGMRLDMAHQLAYESAASLLAPYPRELEEPTAPEHWRSKTDYTGHISRYCRREVEKEPLRATVTVLTGFGGTDFRTDRIVEAARVCSDWEWTVVGPVQPVGVIDLPRNLRFVGVVANPDEWLRDATVVIGSAGDGVVGEVAELRGRLVCIPERRPFGEQQSVGKILESAGLAICCIDWPEAEQWPGILKRALQLDPDRWATVADGLGAKRAAAAIMRIAAITLQGL